jgi:hypothetical protein
VTWLGPPGLAETLLAAGVESALGAGVARPGPRNNTNPSTNMSNKMMTTKARRLRRTALLGRRLACVGPPGGRARTGLRSRSGIGNRVREAILLHREADRSDP